MRDSESGFTIVEVSITAAISAIVAIAMMGMLIGHTNAERRLTNFAQNQEEARLALVALQRDLRSAQPIVAFADTQQYKNTVEVVVYESAESDVVQRVRWRITTAGGADELVRELQAADATWVASHRLRGVANRVEGAPLFTYYSSDGQPFSWSEPPATIAHCAIRVSIDLRAAPNPGPQPTRLVSDVQLRNRLPGGEGCD